MRGNAGRYDQEVDEKEKEIAALRAIYDEEKKVSTCACYVRAMLMMPMLCTCVRPMTSRCQRSSPLNAPTCCGPGLDCAVPQAPRLTLRLPRARCPPPPPPLGVDTAGGLLQPAHDRAGSAARYRAQEGARPSLPPCDLGRPPLHGPLDRSSTFC